MPPAPVVMTEEQVQRYRRHLVLSEVGGKGQRRLMASRVLIVGAGGLGSPAALYLAAAGVGTLGIVDFDVVDLSNLQRQILHHGHDVGRPKVVSAQETLADINPHVCVVAYNEALTRDNARRIFADYDVVVNGSDNFPTRYLINDACVFLQKPLVDGSLFKFEGQMTVYMPGQGCYRCLYPTPPPPGAVPGCAEVGVLGVVCGVVASIQGVETIKLLLGIGEGLVGRLLCFDALAMEFRQVRFHRNPDCPVCGDRPTITDFVDYQQLCGMPPAGGD
jgi:molybdopterin/thiamine biosynthesis adenylyltransferase